MTDSDRASGLLGARACYDLVFVCLPLKMRGATGSPLRPVALARQ